MAYAYDAQPVFTGLVYAFDPYDCSQCKTELATAKTSIISEGQAILSAFAVGSGSLPCNTAICLTGKEAYFLPLSNGVLLLGTMASGMIVIRKKKKK